MERLHPIAAQTVATSASTARNSADFSERTIAVQLQATQDCFVKFGTSAVTAATTDAFIKAGLVYEFDTFSAVRVAAIRSSVDGTLYITELAHRTRRPTR